MLCVSTYILKYLSASTSMLPYCSICFHNFTGVAASSSYHFLLIRYKCVTA
ncbi:hypothetical protein EXN66_Car000546 [Channa argus]|uniref:Uncharacterized protein n=1 Tax=Channa argus TaxID=215402 RepID=A0A6G1QYI2_CHAAH|nr:hypothetical protein EXN66_Car000546 [Channa argus]